MAEGHRAGRVHLVEAQASIVDLDHRGGGFGLLPGLEDRPRGPTFHPTMGSDVVVVGDEAVDGPLELLLRLDALLGGHELLERLVEPLDFAAGLGMVGAGVLGRDAEGEEFLFDHPLDHRSGCGP